MKIKNLVAVVALGLSVYSVASNAAIYRWSFNYNGFSSGEFAFLDFDSSNGNFRLYDNTGQYASETISFADNSYLTSTIGVNGLALDFTAAGTTFLPTPITTTEDSGTVNNFTSAFTAPNAFFAGSIATYDYGIVTANNGSSNEVNNGESTTFKISNDIVQSNIAGVAVRLNFNNGDLNSNGGGGAVWIVGQAVNSGAPVPEAETSAMMVLGLGILGFVARRRKQA